ncbi:MAG: hypothetical protein P4L99_20870 [Chthoniobacter sp.]|nr:hypothetical protein [Chthoniobacter sp.]
MREDLPPPEYQDLHPIPGDGQIPFGWLLSIDLACTAWLLRRHQLGSPAEDRVAMNADPDQDNAEPQPPTAIAKEVAS